jgi:hypothetical protein
MSDFDLKSPDRKSRSAFNERDEEDDEDQPLDSGQQNLLDLSIEFLGYLRREEGVPYTKGELGRAQIQQYILRRHAGELEPRESRFEAPTRPLKLKSIPKPTGRSDHGLCPDRDTLDHYLAQLFNFINPQYYKAAATFELVPAWLRFLESRQIIDAQQRTKTLFELRGLDTELLKVLERHLPDPALSIGVRRWRENAEMKTPLWAKR